MTRRKLWVFAIALLSVFNSTSVLGQVSISSDTTIKSISPPEFGFYSKRIDADGIPIKAAAVVADEALYEARRRLTRMLAKIPNARLNMIDAGSELHIIRKDQMPWDLPENRGEKGRKLTSNRVLDSSIRGLGGLLASCGEENLLSLANDKYYGRDMLVHEMAHNLKIFGLTPKTRVSILTQCSKSITIGLWKDAYAGWNDDEYFAELSVWYFGSRGDTAGRFVPKTAGREALKAYDPESYALFDSLYSGALLIDRIPINRLHAWPPSIERETGPVYGSASSILFHNLTDHEVRVYWIKGAGSRELFETIRPHGSYTRSSYTGSPWLVTDQNDKAIAIFFVESDPGVAEIKD